MTFPTQHTSFFNPSSLSPILLAGPLSNFFLHHFLRTGVNTVGRVSAQHAQGLMFEPKHPANDVLLKACTPSNPEVELGSEVQGHHSALEASLHQKVSLFYNDVNR